MLLGHSNQMTTTDIQEQQLPTRPLTHEIGRMHHTAKPVQVDSFPRRFGATERCRRSMTLKGFVIDGAQQRLVRFWQKSYGIEQRLKMAVQDKLGKMAHHAIGSRHQWHRAPPKLLLFSAEVLL